MIAVAIDTNAYADAMRGVPDVVGVLRLAEGIGVPVVVVGELLAGFAAGARERANREALEAFLRSPRVNVLGADVETADRYADIHRQLRRAGRPVPTNDLWIAALALQHGHRLLTRDEHFARIPGLRVVTSPADVVGA